MVGEQEKHVRQNRHLLELYQHTLDGLIHTGQNEGSSTRGIHLLNEIIIMAQYCFKCGLPLMNGDVLQTVPQERKNQYYDPIGRDRQTFCHPSLARYDIFQQSVQQCGSR
jgi:hypothetical protein